MDMTPEQQAIAEIFFPHNMERFLEVEQNGTRFVHYTTADVAMRILQNKEVWLRKTSCMNDYTEVEHGLDCLSAAYKGKHGIRLRKIIDDLFPGTMAELASLFDGWADDLRDNTYIICFSEHRTTENTLGRLSMWRAYGRSAGVALVMNNTPFLSTSGTLNASTSSVTYMYPEDFEREFERVVNGIEGNVHKIQAMGKDTVKAYLFNAFRFAALCTKHKAFEEELEWRVIYNPNIAPSKYIKKGIELINGSPQPVYKLPLKNVPDEGITGIEIPELLNRLIIGPCSHTLAVREAFADLMAEAGIPDPYERIAMSLIPIR